MNCNPSNKKMISIVTPCFNEEDNIEELYQRIVSVMEKTIYSYEHICIDNCSTDSTLTKLKRLAAIDKRLKVIVNARNFGHIRSPHHAILQSSGDACILIASDLQDPPEIISEFIEKWEQGFKSVLAVKPASEEPSLMSFIRKFYYRLITRISETPLIENATGAGLFDKVVVDILRKIDDPYPYFRGLICEIGFPIGIVPFTQPRRKRGVSKNNFYTLFDIGMLGLINHSTIPIRLASFFGFIIGSISLVIALVFFIFKLLYWDNFPLGVSPIIIGMFFMFGLVLIFIGLLGEYIASIHTYLRNRPVVVEKERINF